MIDSGIKRGADEVMRQIVQSANISHRQSLLIPESLLKSESKDRENRGYII